jgi:hypothetical protein
MPVNMHVPFSFSRIMMAGLLLFFFFIRALQLMPRMHLSLRLIVQPLNIKRHRSLSQAVLISFGSTSGPVYG